MYSSGRSKRQNAIKKAIGAGYLEHTLPDQISFYGTLLEKEKEEHDRKANKYREGVIVSRIGFFMPSSALPYCLSLQSLFSGLGIELLSWFPLAPITERQEHLKRSQEIEQNWIYKIYVCGQKTKSD